MNVREYEQEIIIMYSPCVSVNLSEHPGACPSIHGHPPCTSMDIHGSPWVCTANAHVYLQTSTEMHDGCSWICMDIHGCPWMCTVNAHGYSQMSTDIHDGYPRKRMDVHGYARWIYRFVGLDGHPVWGSMDVRRYPWISLDAHCECPWICTDIHGHPRTFTSDIHGYTWISMDVHGK